MKRQEAERSTVSLTMMMPEEEKEWFSVRVREREWELCVFHNVSVSNGVQFGMNRSLIWTQVKKQNVWLEFDTSALAWVLEGWQPVFKRLLLAMLPRPPEPRPRQNQGWNKSGVRIDGTRPLAWIVQQKYHIGMLEVTGRQKNMSLK